MWVPHWFWHCKKCPRICGVEKLHLLLWMVCAQQSNLPSLGLEISNCRICGDADCEVVRLLVSKSYPIKYRELDKEGVG
mgnify:FL=1